MSDKCAYCGHDADLQLNIATGCSEGVYECRDVYHCRFRMVDKVERLKAENAAWSEKAKTWLASPAAAQRLDGYRELTDEVARLKEDYAIASKGMSDFMEERDESRAEVERLKGELSECKNSVLRDVSYIGELQDDVSRLKAREAKLEAALLATQVKLVPCSKCGCDVVAPTWVIPICSQCMAASIEKRWNDLPQATVGPMLSENGHYWGCPVDTGGKCDCADLDKAKETSR